MRVTNAQTRALMGEALNRNGLEVGRLMQQVSSNRRILQPSDDPIASVRLLRNAREEVGLAQYRLNIGSVSSSLGAQETQLRSTSNALLSIRDMLLWARNGTHSEQDLGAIAAEMKTLEGLLAGLLNSRDESGRYLFSGTRIDQPALLQDPATGRYSPGGNAGVRQAVVGSGVLLDENVTLLAMLGPDLPVLNGLHALQQAFLAPGMQSGDPALVKQTGELLDVLDRSLDGVLAAITELGGRQGTLDLLTQANEDRSLVNQRLEYDLSHLDYPSATLDLENYKLSIKASQKTYLAIQDLSLFNLL